MSRSGNTLKLPRWKCANSLAAAWTRMGSSSEKSLLQPDFRTLPSAFPAIRESAVRGGGIWQGFTDEAGTRLVNLGSDFGRAQSAGVEVGLLCGSNACDFFGGCFC